VPRLRYILTAISLFLWQPTHAGENAQVEIGIRNISMPCGLAAGDIVEFSVLARNMNNARQVLITFSWHPENAIVGAVAKLADGPKNNNLLAPFPPQIDANRAEFGMASFTDGALSGEAELATFGLELAPHIGPDTRVEVWIEEISLGPSFTERDFIRPLQGVILSNYCDTDQQVLNRALFVSPEQTTISLSSVPTGQVADQSSGEVSLRARFFQQGFFAADQPLIWTIENQGGSLVYVLTAEEAILVEPGQPEQSFSVSDARGDSFILLDAEPGTDMEAGKAAVTACVELEGGPFCASSLITWDPPTAVLEERDLPLPAQLRLEQNYPNPFNGATIIPLFVPDTSDILRVDILNATGQVVKTLLEKHPHPGHHLIPWDGHSHDGRILASGLYFYRVRLGAEERVHSMVLLR